MMPVAVKTGEPGEMLVRVGQPALFRDARYYNRPDETAGPSRTDGYIPVTSPGPTNDVPLYVDPRKTCAQWRFNIYTKEVEQALCKTRCSRCRGGWGADAVFGEAVAASSNGSKEALHACLVVEHVRIWSPATRSPNTSFIVDALPRNSLGKVLAETARSGHRSRRQRAGPRERPRCGASQVGPRQTEAADWRLRFYPHAADASCIDGSQWGVPRARLSDVGRLAHNPLLSAVWIERSALPSFWAYTAGSLCLRPIPGRHARSEGFVTAAIIGHDAGNGDTEAFNKPLLP